MSISRFDRVLERYEAKLIALEQASPTSSEDQVLEVLVARDAVHTALAAKNPNIHRLVQRAPQEGTLSYWFARIIGRKRPEILPTVHPSLEISVSIDSLRTLIQLDGRLKKQAHLITGLVNLVDWRASLNPPADVWWWFFETPARPHTLDRFDWLWNMFTFMSLIIASTLGADILLRFSSIAPDTLGVLAIIVDVMITAMIAGGTLTHAGRGVIERLLALLNIPKYFWLEARFASAGLLLLGLLAFRLALPQFAVYYNNQGFNNYRAGQWTSAQLDYDRAIKLYPDYPEAHYNYGLLYEDLADFGHARAEYQLAVQGGLVAAYNNLARLHILEENNFAAVPLLLTGLSLTQDDTVKYDLYKNLGWVRLDQARYAEAEIYLGQAIDLANERAPAHCLLAQVLESQDDTASALVEWNNCLKYADGRNPDEDTWIGIARQRLATEGGE